LRYRESQASRSGQTPFAARSFADGLRCTAMSRVTSLHWGEELTRVSFACQLPTAGEAISANQK